MAGASATITIRPIGFDGVVTQLKGIQQSTTRGGHDIDVGKAPKQFCDLARSIEDLDDDLSELIRQTISFMEKTKAAYEAEDYAIANSYRNG